MTRFFPVGDSALVVEFGDEIDPAINRRVHALTRLLSLDPLDGVAECAPTYRSLLVRYDPLALDYRAVAEWAQSKLSRAESLRPEGVRRIEVPTVYGGERGPDLEFVAQHNGLSPQEVIRIHSGAEYTVYMMGFTPGYPYMGKLDPAIAAPRNAAHASARRVGGHCRTANWNLPHRLAGRLAHHRLHAARVVRSESRAAVSICAGRCGAVCATIG